MKISCKNHTVCRNTTLFKDDFCIDCDCLFGSWRNRKQTLIIDEIEKTCPLCLIKNKIVYRPDCEHYLCVNCFRKVYLGIELLKPVFPFPDREIEYYVKLEAGIDDEFVNDGSIIKYFKDLQYWNTFRDIHSINKISCEECI
jgi:hypothetical protein